MTSGNISEILFQVNHVALKDSIKKLWPEHSKAIGLNKKFEEVKFLSITLGNFLKSTLGADVLTLLRITKYQIVLATLKSQQDEKVWAITGKGPAVITISLSDPKEEILNYTHYPFELAEFVEEILCVSQVNAASIMEVLVNSTNQIIQYINEQD